ncbi:contact-dependent growth inhibition system immunity protein [Paenibacillus sp. PAMC 26794]|uniref:contact-dependent growth inhibition system immunity protein n=1 Tax=Paenibacillus sp. PAMC 26794 TaxID=1257080 RepID=UPI00037EBB05|nr:contact-dependent growth inhibition system immunity protein [Paenibacillus sp. PAMC 26794]
MRKTIKEMYDLKQSTQEAEQEYALDTWYNRLISKTVEEIDIGDTSRMLSQKILVELAIQKAIEFLIDDPQAGEKYDGQLLELLHSIDLNEFKDLSQLKLLLQKINNSLLDLEWLDEEDKKEYSELLCEFMTKVNM